MIEQFQRKAYDRFLQWKRVHYFLETDEFKRAFANLRSTMDNAWGEEALIKLVDGGDLVGLKEWAVQFTKTKDLSYRQLRQRASKRNLYNYSRLSKDELIKKLGENTYG